MLPNPNEPAQEYPGCKNYNCGEYPLKVFDPEYRIRKAVERMNLSGNPEGRHLAAAMRKLVRSACGRTCFSVSIHQLLDRVRETPYEMHSGILLPATLVAYRQERQRILCSVVKLYCQPFRGGPQKGPLFEDIPDKTLQDLKDSGFTTGVICRGDFLKPIRQALQNQQGFLIL